ncbi:MAG: Nif3-like dinuclear metal center hexameric protein [Faecalimonas sp.]|nr:Nif3-like dinuclear metal center hexameric protein [Faecalimonas sp.]
MLCRDVIKKIEDVYPKTAALEWDNVGLLVGRSEKEVRGIYVALDATDEVIDAAIACGADLLVTHHPLIFSPLKRITDEAFVGERVLKLLQADITYYAIHTNYDVLGMADLSAALLDLQDTEALEVTGLSAEDGKTEIGIGRVGMLVEEQTLGNCCALVKQAFALPNVKVFGSLGQKVQRIAVSPGSGKHMAEFALAKGADVLVTGDIDHHEGIDAVAQGLAIIDAGHYGLEHIFIADMSVWLAENIEGVQVMKEDIRHPFMVL